MRVGAFARSLMLRGECSVDLVLMCIGMSIVRFLFIVQVMSLMDYCRKTNFGFLQ